MRYNYLNLYQDKISHNERIARSIEPIKEYEAGFGDNALNAIKTGWYMISSLIIIFITLWPLWLIGLIGVIIFFKYKRKKN